MLFNSPVYILLFLPLVVVVYYQLTRLPGDRPRKLWLVAASLFFYAYWKPLYLCLLLASVGVNFALIQGIRGATPARSWRWDRQSGSLLIGILFNLALLGYYKYAGFFIENANAFLGTDYPALHLVLPLAISFFTFQQIAYLVDAYRGKTQGHGLIDYLLFVTFFPQLIAGPIVHHSEMMPQFQAGNAGRVHWNHVLVGAFVFALGLFKKVVVADTFAGPADAGFNATDPLPMLEAWGACLSYTFQIYFDFSGYTDMAIGAGLMMNIHLPINFNSPYKALNIQDFWRRWHMTLSRWLRDYVYVPLGGNRHGLLRTCLAILLTFVLGGLWHGAGWTFIIWGALHGFALVIHRLWSQTGLRLPTIVAWPLTFGFVVITWVFFRANDLDGAVRMILSMLDVSGGALSVAFQDQLAALVPTVFTPSRPDALPSDYLSEWVLVGAFLALIVTVSTKNTMAFRDHYLREDAVIGLPMYLILSVVAAIGITFLFASSSSTFLYFNF